MWWDLRKLGIKEWLAKISQSKYRNAQGRVRANGTFSNNFLDKVGLHQGSVLNTLSFITVLGTLSKEIRPLCQEELFYADELPFVT